MPLRYSISFVEKNQKKPDFLVRPPLCRGVGYRLTIIAKIRRAKKSAFTWKVRHLFVKVLAE